MTLDGLLNIFRAIGEETRLRVMALLLRGELTVSEITQILGQSQPRVSRHLKILTDAGLIEKFREGSWIFCRAAPSIGEESASILAAVAALNRTADRLIARDADRFEQSRRARAEVAADYFERNAGDWDTVRGLHVEEAAIEVRLRKMVGEAAVDLFVDIGTGTGRMLALFADRFDKGVGFDLSREMLAVARANLDRAGVAHAQVRHGDLFALPMETATADLVCLHQVLHFLAEPGAAVKEAARILKPGGRLVIVDFAPHELEFLRDEHAHRRLGFPDDEVAAWCAASGLDLIDSVALAPKKSERPALTVRLWLARAPETIRKLKKHAA